MSEKVNAKTNLENFDELLGSADPATVEIKFKELLPEAEAQADKSVYLQILSQLALTQAMLKKFDEAHSTLDQAESLLTPAYDLAKVRILLERGRVFHQKSLFGSQDKAERAKDLAQAFSFFKNSYELSKTHHFDYHTANAAHMLAIASEKIQDKILWNERAIECSSASRDQRTRAWISALQNNLGQNYLEAKEYSKALAIFQATLEMKEKEGVPFFIRHAKWTLAHTLRLLDRLDESLEILNLLVKENEDMVKNNKLDVPEQVLSSSRGFLYEDLAEIYMAKAKQAASAAYDDLSKEEWIHLTEYKHRLDRMLEIRGSQECL